MKFNKETHHRIIVTILTICIIYLINGCANADELSIAVIYPEDANMACDNPNHIFNEEYGGFDEEFNTVSFLSYAVHYQNKDDGEGEHIDYRCGLWAYYAYGSENEKTLYNNPDQLMNNKDNAESSGLCSHYDMEDDDTNGFRFVTSTDWADHVPRQEAETGNVELNNDGTTITATYTHRVENPCTHLVARNLMKREGERNVKAEFSWSDDGGDSFKDENTVTINPKKDYCQGSSSTGLIYSDCATDVNDKCALFEDDGCNNIKEELEPLITDAIEDISD